jgi:two-component system chemotaxis response regulator CheB
MNNKAADGQDSRGKIVVVGASLGGVSALQRLAADLPARFPSPVIIVLHIGANRSSLPELLASAGPNTASHARDGEPLRSGHLAIAPPGQHLLVNDGTLRLTRGPKENWARPAIDPLFRSAALAYGPRAVGIVLTGNLDDGTAGLKAIKDCGGVTIVEDPATAFASSMPASAMEYVAVDYVLPIESIGGHLEELIMQPRQASLAPPAQLRFEHGPAMGTVNAMEDLKKIAEPSSLACPECGGGLWELSDKKPPRYRCHTGHAFSLSSLKGAMDQITENALFSAIRALQERAEVNKCLAEHHRALAKAQDAATLEDRAAADEACAIELRKLCDTLEDRGY